MNRNLHIVCFTVPYPISYGGVFDLYYKIKALSDRGIKIHLHCYTTGNTEKHLENICEQVYYYPRSTGLLAWSTRIPYIVSSRISPQLVGRLNNDDYPVLAEGVHSTSFLLNPGFNKKKVALRLHNVEHIYYNTLHSHASNPFKAFYYRMEANLLQQYEQRIADKVDKIFAVSSVDQQYYTDRLGSRVTEFLPVFVDFDFTIQPGRGCYCLYHGNLSVEENAAAVVWLLDNVFANCEVPLIIAGKDPSLRLRRIIRRARNVTLVANPPEAVLHDLLLKAQCHVLPSLNATGVKLKLLHALYTGRHCVVNTAAVRGSGLESVCHIADDPEHFTELVLQCRSTPFTLEEAQNRKQVLAKLFDRDAQANQLIRWLS